jgi:uncharacterized protein (DUF427 family)
VEVKMRNMKAIWNNTILAESNETVVVEGNHYFPENSVKMNYFRPSDTHSICPWKGTASYYSVEADGKVNKDAAWYYPDPKEAASMVAGKIAFWKGVEIKE